MRKHFCMDNPGVGVADILIQIALRSYLFIKIYDDTCYSPEGNFSRQTSDTRQTTIFSFRQPQNDRIKIGKYLILTVLKWDYSVKNASDLLLSGSEISVFPLAAYLAGSILRSGSPYSIAPVIDRM